MKCGSCFATFCYCTGFIMWVITAYVFRFSQEGKVIAGDFWEELGPPEQDLRPLYLKRSGHFLGLYVAIILGLWTLIFVCCVVGLFVACRDLEDDFEFKVKSTNGEDFVNKWNGKNKSRKQ